MKNMYEPDITPEEKTRLEGKLTQLKSLLVPEEQDLLEKKALRLEKKAKERANNHKKNIGQMFTGFFKDRFDGIVHDIKGMFSRKDTEEIPELKEASFKKISKRIVIMYDSMPIETRREVNELFGGLFEKASAKMFNKEETDFTQIEEKKEEEKIEIPEPKEEPKEKIAESFPLIEIECRVKTIKQIFSTDSEDKIREFVEKNTDISLEHLVEDYLINTSIGK